MSGRLIPLNEYRASEATQITLGSLLAELRKNQQDLEELFELIVDPSWLTPYMNQGGTDDRRA